jgi:4-phospho-D-threonate 3-dehydrogenase / 4-phospho-D-erythronate 3-dehydrogenase
MAKRPLAITLGDPAGIGPEITVKALDDPKVRAMGPVVVIGSAFALEEARAICQTQLPIKRIEQPEEAEEEAVNVLHTGMVTSPIAWGQLKGEYGAAAYEYIARAIDLAVQNRVSAVVTAPLNKEALHLGGYNYPGHTEIFTKLTGSRGSCMMLIHGNLRVSHVTTHVALRKVPDLVTQARVYQVIMLTYDALKRFGIAEPRIAAAGLNPHSGEGGLFGTEDDEQIRPAIERARAEGINVEGPVPGDTIFVKTRAGTYDAAIAMYHDQGHVAVKTVGFSVDPVTNKWTAVSGVNVTLGLPIIRTSVDHGTAFDIAGHGIASSASMVEAMEIAVQMATHGAHQIKIS